MKILVVYDSMYGNTEKIARAIGESISKDTKVLAAKEAVPADLEGIDLLIAGAPTQGGRPTTPMRDFLNKLQKQTISGKSVAAFDTRISAKWVGIFGYAAGRIGRALKKLGGNLVVNPEPFFVQGTEGPLKEGEEERAAVWARKVAGIKP